MRRVSLAIVLHHVLAAAAFAAPAVTTAQVNFRSGPGTTFASQGTIPEGAQVDVGECDIAGGWCSVTFGGNQGFVSAKYLMETQSDRPGWPRSYTIQEGAEVVLYQPQVTEWKDFTDLKALVATEYRASKDAKPVYGVIGLEGKTALDREAGEVVVSDVKAIELNFSALDRQQLSNLSLQVGRMIPTGAITVPEERLSASLADYGRMSNVEGLKSDPPPIFISNNPAILVQTDGKEVLAPVKGVDGLFFVVNSNWDIFKVDADGAYYLRDEKSWLTAKSLPGEWQAASELPELVSKLPDEGSWKDARAAMPPAPFEGGVAPKVFYSDMPAELIRFDGEPKLEAVPGTGLRWASNSDGDVFFDAGDGSWYVLLSGRWFSAKSLEGPWIFATPNLPADFKNIPDDAPYYNVRSSVPGTSENQEARLKASIPEIARVATDGSVKAEVAYSGDPKFEPISGTSVSYGVNTNDQVFQVGSKYYVLKNGVWFVGDNPNGPFAVARSVPEEIYKIPPSSPAYNATYVRVYDTEDDAVWFGYTMGYLGAFLAWDTFVYGTGWYYPAYWDFGWTNGYWPYYPRPATYGVGAFYNPARGTFGRYGYAYGPYRGIAGGAAYNPSTGTYFRGGAVAGPAGERGFVSAYNPRTDTGAIARGGHNVYGSWGTAGVRRGSDWARASGGAIAGGGEGARWRTSAGNQGFIASGNAGDIYAGRDGNIYRRQDGQWQKHSDGGWSPVQRPASENLGNAATNPQAAQRIRNQAGAQRTSQPRLSPQAAPDHLNFDRADRLRGNQLSLGRRAEFHPQLQGGFGGGGFARGGGFGGGGFHGGGFHGGFRR